MYTFNSEVSIPLLEGGLLYRGVFSELSLEGFNEVLLFADNQSLHTVQFVKISPTGYQATASQIVPPFQSQLVIQSVADDPQQFFGMVTQEQAGYVQFVKFFYKDIREPITIGVITIVVVGTAAFLCALNELIGIHGNRECKKLRADFGFQWKDGLQMSCKVECLDQSESSVTKPPS
jgi:hypothetical protein